MSEPIQINLHRPYLAEAIATVSRFCGRGRLPILGTVLLTADGQKLQVSATDLDMSISGYVPSTAMPFSLAVSPKPLAELLALIETDELAIGNDNSDRLEIIHTRGDHLSRFALQGFPGEDFPILAEPSETSRIYEICIRDLTRALGAVLPFATTPKVRRWEIEPPAVHLSASNGKLTLAACDGPRFHMEQVELRETADNSEVSLSIPLPALQGVLRAIRDAGEDESLRLFIDESHVAFHVKFAGGLSDFTVTSRRLTPTLDLDKIVSQFEYVAGTVTVNRRDFNRALRRLSRIAKADGNRVELVIENGSATLRAQSLALGLAVEPLTAEVTGVDTNLVFNIKNLLDTATMAGPNSINIAYQADAQGIVNMNGSLLKPIRPAEIAEAEAQVDSTCIMPELLAA